MRILLVAGKLTYSNEARYTLTLTRGLLEQEHAVEVAALGGPLYSAIVKLGVESYQVKLNYFSFRRLVQFLRDFDPDLVHATGGTSALQIASRLSRSLGAPLIHTAHSWLPDDHEESMPRLLRGVIAVNHDLREYLVNEQNVPKGKIKVIPYGIDGESLSARIPADRPNSIPVVGTIGRLERGRRHAEFIRAASLVRDRVPEVLFMIAGEGPNEDGLRRLTRELKLEDALTFVQPQSDAIDIYGVLDILVIVSDWGGVGLNLLEGMARGLPIIATGGGEVFSLLGKERVCILTPAADTEQLAQAIVDLLADPNQRQELGVNARQYVKSRYPLDEQVIRIEDYYNEVMASSGA